MNHENLYVLQIVDFVPFLDHIYKCFLIVLYYVDRLWYLNFCGLKILKQDALQCKNRCLSSMSAIQYKHLRDWCNFWGLRIVSLSVCNTSSTLIPSPNYYWYWYLYLMTNIFVNPVTNFPEPGASLRDVTTLKNFAYQTSLSRWIYEWIDLTAEWLW